MCAYANTHTHTCAQTQVLKPSAKAKNPYTHDAHVHGTSRKQKRGVRLGAVRYAQGYWIPIGLKDSPHTSEPIAKPKATTKVSSKRKSNKPAASSPGSRSSKRHRTEVSPFRDYVQPSPKK